MQASCTIVLSEGHGAGDAWILLVGNPDFNFGCFGPCKPWATAVVIFCLLSAIDQTFNDVFLKNSFNDAFPLGISVSYNIRMKNIFRKFRTFCYKKNITLPENSMVLSKINSKNTNSNYIAPM